MLPEYELAPATPPLPKRREILHASGDETHQGCGLYQSVRITVQKLLLPCLAVLEAFVRVSGPLPEPLLAFLQVEEGALRLFRANGDIMYSVPLERIAGLAHPAPNVLKIKVKSMQSSSHMDTLVCGLTIAAILWLLISPILAFKMDHMGAATFLQLRAGDCAQLLVDEGTTGTLEVQETALGGGFAPTTELYTELVKVHALLRLQKRFLSDLKYLFIL